MSTENNNPKYPHELAAALDGTGNELDCYLELRDAKEIAADIRALTGYKTPTTNALTKREEIAKCLMAGMMADPSRNGDFEGYARDAVKGTDALLAELDKTQ